jgi:hypothetical protein
LAVEPEHDVHADASRIEIGEAAAHIDHRVVLEPVIGPKQQEDHRAGGERRQIAEGDRRRPRSRFAAAARNMIDRGRQSAPRRFGPRSARPLGGEPL